MAVEPQHGRAKAFSFLVHVDTLLNSCCYSTYRSPVAAVLLPPVRA